MSKMKGSDFKKARIRKRLAALGRRTCPVCNNGTPLMDVPDSVRVPIQMGQGDKAKTVWVGPHDVVGLKCCTACEWHTTVPAGNVEWSKFTSRERDKDGSYEREVSAMKQTAWRLQSGEPRLESAYITWTALLTQIENDRHECFQATSGQIVRRLLQVWYHHRLANDLSVEDDPEAEVRADKLARIFAHGAYSRKAVQTVLRAMILLDHENEKWEELIEEAIEQDPRLGSVLQGADFRDIAPWIADGTAAFRHRCRNLATWWINSLMDNPSALRYALDKDEESVAMDELFPHTGEQHPVDKMVSVRFVVRLMTKYQGQPKVREARAAAGAVIHGHPPCYLLEAKAAIEVHKTALAEWDAALQELLQRFLDGKKIVLNRVPKAMQNFFCVEALGWSESEFQQYAETSYVYYEAPDLDGPVANLAAVASLVERYTNSGLAYLRERCEREYQMAYGYEAGL